MDVGLGASKPAIVSFSTSAAKNGILKRNICQLSQREAVNRQLLTIALFRCYSKKEKKGRHRHFSFWLAFGLQGHKRLIKKRRIEPLEQISFANISHGHKL